MRNVPNLLWIFTIFLVFKMKSTPAGITAFTLFTSAAWLRLSVVVSMPWTRASTKQECRKDLPLCKSSTISSSHKRSVNCCQLSFHNFVTVIKDTSLLYSVIALQELFGASQILMGRYFEPEQVFSLYILIALIYFSFNLSISSLSRMLAKRWQQAAE